jgi:hypothetical protein
MNGVKANARPRMENTRLREPSVLQLPHSRPVQVMFLAATNENLSPQPRHPDLAHPVGFSGRYSCPQQPWRWKCGNRRSDFQGQWEGWKNSFIVFPCFPRTVISTACFSPAAFLSSPFRGPHLGAQLISLLSDAGSRFFLAASIR